MFAPIVPTTIFSMPSPSRQTLEILVRGRRLCVDVAGTGLPCVLLHPFPFDRRYFSDVADQIAARAHTVVPDLRGFGASELGGPFSIADLADDVAALLDHLRIDRAVVVGLSMGGYVALAFAAKYPRRTLGIALSDTRAGADSPDARANRDKDAAFVREQGNVAFIERQLPRLLSSAASESLRAHVRQLGTQNSETIVEALQALRDRPDRRNELASITCPAVVLVGTEDVMTPPAEAAAIATAIPSAVLVELPGAGHLANLEAPAPFSQAIIGFIGRVQSAISASKP
jgi:3-oxoadipate enol-lactonase